MATRWIAQLRAHCSGLTDEVDERGLSEDQVNMFADFDAAAAARGGGGAGGAGGVGNGHGTLHGNAHLRVQSAPRQMSGGAGGGMGQGEGRVLSRR